MYDIDLFYDNRPNITARLKEKLKTNYLFKINSGYSRKLHLGKNYYYVIALNIKEAKNKYLSKMSWMTIYSIAIINDTNDIDFIVLHPDKHIIFE